MSGDARAPTGNEAVRPFLPAKDFDLSKRFYEALGFDKVLDGEVAIFNAAFGGFVLQRYYQKDWAENTMLQLMVDDLDAWWAHIGALDLPGRFGVQAPKAPALQRWGLRVAYVYDPSGVLWHVSQRREQAPHDYPSISPARTEPVAGSPGDAGDRGYRGDPADPGDPRASHAR